MPWHKMTFPAIAGFVLFACILPATALPNGPSKPSSSTTTTTTTSKAFTTSACPAGKTPYTLSSQNCNFDSTTALVATAVPTPYCGVDFQAFQMLTDQPVQAAGVAAHSEPNFAFTSAQTETTGGQSMITINYPGSTAKSFDFLSLYFGCILSSEASQASSPQQCTMNIAGYIGSDNSVDNATLVCADSATYNPTTLTGVQQMRQHYVSSACKGLSFAQIFFSIEAGLSLLQPRTVLEVDDVVLSVTGCK